MSAVRSSVTVQMPGRDKEETDMTVAEVIRKKRKEQGLTQEQVAQRLGVSAPAVNKWERGSSYPDITILPAWRACSIRTSIIDIRIGGTY